jgi:hypothetical protein
VFCSYVARERKATHIKESCHSNAAFRELDSFFLATFSPSFELVQVSLIADSRHHRHFSHR